MKTKRMYTSFLMTVFFLSCNSPQEHSNTAFIKPQVDENHSFIKPTIIQAGKPKIVQVGSPKVVPANTNVHVAQNSKIVLAGIPKVCIPGQDSLTFPKSYTALDSPFAVGKPDVVIAKDASSKEPNPHSFSTFSKLQGLKNGTIRSMIEDHLGNLWFGTFGGGICRYDGRTFAHYSDKNGLKYNFVKCMLQDRSSNIWFGTNGEGITKYDGKTFTHLTIQNGLCPTGIESILEDRFGNLWFGTNGKGVYRFDGKYFTQFTTSEGLSNNTVSNILEDHYGNLWFSTNGGVSKYNGHSFTHFTEREGLVNNTVHKAMEDDAGNLWFGTNGGVSKFDGQTFTQFTTKEGLSDDRINTVFQDNSGNLWFGTSVGGISKYDGKTFIHFTKKEGLSDNGILSILEDRTGNLWFGTNGEGVAKYNGKIFTHFTEKEGLNHDRVVSIIQDRSGNLWFGTWGNGVSKYDGKSFTYFTEGEGLSHNLIYCMLEDRAGNLWFGTDGRGACKYDGHSFTHFTEKEGLSNNVISAMFEDHLGNLWFGTFRGGVTKYDGKTFIQFTAKEGFPDNLVYSICEDNAGNLWFGTFNKGAVKYDGKSFTYFGVNEGLSNNFVLSILKDHVGNLWFGTYGGGVTKYDGKTFTHFTEKDGLSNNYIYSMLEDRRGNLWFGTRFGISQFNQTMDSRSPSDNEVPFTNYTYEDGFLGMGCARNALFEAKDGTIWMGANDRLTAYHPPQIAEMGHAVSPKVQLTDITFFNENIDWISLAQKRDSTITLGNGVEINNFRFNSLSKWYNLPEHLSLAYDNNYLTFNFIGITMSQPQKVKYQYQLEGLDKNWSAPTLRTEAPYGNLPNGTYTFKVKAMNSKGVWSETVDYTFTIRPPWYRTWWACGVWTILLLGSAYYIYLFQLNRRLAAAETLRIKELDAIKTRLYTNITHEFRTPLTIIIGMADQVMNNPKDWFHDGIRLIRSNGKQLLSLVNQMLDLSKLESGSMSIHWQQGDIIEYLRYLQESFYSLAIYEHLDLQFHSDKAIFLMDYDAEKLRNIVSNLLANAIKYTPDGGSVNLSLHTEGGYFFIKVSDTGIGIPADKLQHVFDRFYQVDDSYTRRGEGTGIGLTLTKELIQLLGGTIDVKSELGKGSEFTVTLPVTRKAEIIQNGWEYLETDNEQPQKISVIEKPLASSEKEFKNKPLVLIIEDNPDVVHYLRICLQNDYRLYSAANGAEGLKKALDLIPDLVISDVMMPEMDGYELCQKLKEDIQTSHIPIVLLTAKGDIDSKVEGLELGADEYLAKPFEERELKARLKNLLHLRHTLQERYRSTSFWQTEQSIVDIKPTLDDIFITDLKAFIVAHMADTNLDVHSLEKQFGMSRTKLHRKLAALTNMSTTAFIRFVRLTKASEILRDEKNQTISEIAYSVGFTSLSHFTRCFHDVFNMSPTQWRDEKKP